jgi:hypothetical protein
MDTKLSRFSKVYALRYICSQISVLKLMNSFQETRTGSYAIQGHTNFTVFNFLQSITTWRKREYESDACNGVLKNMQLFCKYRFCIILNNNMASMRNIHRDVSFTVTTAADRSYFLC